MYAKNQRTNAPTETTIFFQSGVCTPSLLGARVIVTAAKKTPPNNDVKASDVKPAAPALPAWLALLNINVKPNIKLNIIKKAMALSTINGQKPYVA